MKIEKTKTLLEKKEKEKQRRQERRNKLIVRSYTNLDYHLYKVF